MYSYLLIILLLVVGLYFTFRTKFIQMRLLKESIHVVTEKKGNKNSVSAFTTLLGNLFYCEGCLNYIAKRQVGKITLTIFRILACVLIFVGALLDFGLVWNLADVLMGVMAIMNLPVLLILGKKALTALNDYCKQRKEGKDPVFKSSTVGLEGETDFWN